MAGLALESPWLGEVEASKLGHYLDHLKDFEEDMGEVYSSRVSLPHKPFIHPAATKGNINPVRVPGSLRVDTSDEEMFWERQAKKPRKGRRLLVGEDRDWLRIRQRRREAFPHQVDPNFNPLFPVSGWVGG